MVGGLQRRGPGPGRRGSQAPDVATASTPTRASPRDFPLGGSERGDSSGPWLPRGSHTSASLSLGATPRRPSASGAWAYAAPRFLVIS